MFLDMVYSCSKIEIHTSGHACVTPDVSRHSDTCPLLPPKTTDGDWIGPSIGRQTLRTLRVKGASCRVAHCTAPHRTSVHQRLASSQLVWLSDALMRAPGDGSTQTHDRSPSFYFPPSLVRTTYFPVPSHINIPLFTSSWMWQPFSRYRSTHFSSCRFNLWLKTLPPLLKGLCASADHACVLFLHHWEGRSPRPLETAYNWIMTMPLTYS